MTRLIITHELKNLFFSPRFTATFAVSTALLLLSVLVGIGQYERSMRQYETTTALVRQEQRESRGWMGLSATVLRRPDPMQIFVSGVNDDVGRIAGVTNFTNVKLTHSTYSDDPIYAFFRFIDPAFIVTVVFSLLALLFTYDSVNGEAERGTLQLTFSNAVPRARYILGKFIGAWLGLALPLALPVLLSLLLLLVFRIPFTADHWMRLAGFGAASLAYISFFIALGLFLSTTTKRSSVSFLASLVAWVCIVFIIPRAAVTVAGQIVPVPTVAEVEAERDAYNKDRWSQYESVMQRRWKERNEPTASMTAPEREAYREAHMWEWMEQDDKDRKDVQKDNDAFAFSSAERMRNKKGEQERLAFLLSRFSPASAFQLSAMTLAGTDISLKTRTEDALNVYRPQFIAYKEKKQKENGNSGGVRISMDSETGVKIDVGRGNGALDLTGMPQYEDPVYTVHDALAPSIADIGLMGMFTLAAFAGAFVRFLRYDVR